MHSTLAARVLAELSPELQADVALRIATMSETNPDVIRDIEQGLRLKLANVVGQEFAAAGGVDALAEILNRAGRSTERNVVGAISESDQELADEIKLRLFTFEDLVILEDRDLQLVLREVDQKELQLALRGVEQNVVEKILANMSQRGAEMLREDMENSAPQKQGGRRRGPGQGRRRRAAPRGRRRARHPPRRRRGRGGRVSAYGPFELAPLEAVIVPERPAPGAAPRSTPFASRPSKRASPPASRRRRASSTAPPAALAAAAEQLQALRADAAASVEADAVDLALRIAEQAVGAAIAADPELVVEAVRGALRRLVERDRVLILVNPDDLELVRDHVARLVGELGGIEHCEVQAERRVRPGGAIVRTSEGEVDATLETKLARAREVLEHELANG